MPGNLVAVYFFLVFPRTGCASPAIPPTRFGQQRRVYTGHVEKLLTSITLDSFLPEMYISRQEMKRGIVR